VLPAAACCCKAVSFLFTLVSRAVRIAHCGAGVRPRPCARCSFFFKKTKKDFFFENKNKNDHEG
jgi:hypothetical protein